MAGVLGFEPRDAEIKPGALPLGDTPTEKSLIRYKEDFI